MEQHTKKHARHYFYHLKNALGGLKIAMRGVFLNIKSIAIKIIIIEIKNQTVNKYLLFPPKSNNPKKHKLIKSNKALLNIK